MTAPADIEEFRLVRQLGRGGMGTVYLAHDSILDRPVALKIVTGVSEDSRLRFLTEARAIARLHHPNVVAIHRTGTTADGEPYLIQELIRGQALDRLARPVPASRCLALATGIARGLAAAHRRGVLHRDVKPSNIMIDEAGTPRLLDFGIAKLSGLEPEPVALPAPAPAGGNKDVSPPALDDTAELPGAARDRDDTPARTPSRARSRAVAGANGDPVDQPPASNTLVGAILGTPRYMAPEMWHGDTASARSDLYSLGVVMYELLAGEPPFAQNDAEALRDAVLRAAARPIGERVPDLDPAFAALITRCLALDPAARPESADEVVAQLERIASGAATIPEGNPYRGLAPFEAEQRAVFFGRGTEIAAVVDRLRSESFVVVTGDSGIGKSSLCRAGVLPAIAAGALGDGRSWTTRTGTLGRRPVAALAELLGVPAIALDGADGSLAPQLGRQLALGTGRGVLVLIDQGEELVTQAALADATAAAAVLAVLGEGIPGVKVVVAVRGDFLTRVAALPALRGVMTRSLHLVRGLSADDAREVVVAPARAKGVAFETKAMVDELVDAIVDRPAALPLLSFALSELWARRDLDRAVIPARALDEIGGVVGALASHADRVVTSLSAPERLAARRVLLALVTADGTRASRSHAELVAGDPLAARALEALVSGRLVAARDVADGEPVYELAHESLLSAWGTLRGWLDDAAGQRGIRTRLASAAAEWARLGKPQELLWRRSQIAETTPLDQLAPADQGFLAASRRAARLRLAITVAIAAAIPAAAGATWLGLAMRDDARRAAQMTTQLSVADRRLQTAEAAVRDARTARAAAIDLFDKWNSVTDRAQYETAEAEIKEGEQRWRDASALFGGARAALREATGGLEATLLVVGNRPQVRHAMADTIYRHLVVAEEAGDDDAIPDLVQRLALYDDGTYTARLQDGVMVSISSAGATRIEVHRYLEDADRRLTLSPDGTSSEGVRIEMRLSRGSYRAQVTAPGIDPVVLPFVVARDGATRFDIALPRPGEVPRGMIYIPPGSFQLGSTERSSFRTLYYHALPMHRTVTGAYLISRTEVTFAEWLAFLRDLPPADRERHRQQAPLDDENNVAERSVHLKIDARKQFTLIFRPTKVPYKVREGEPIEYRARPEGSRTRQAHWEELPTSGVTYDDATAYAAWLAGTKRIPHARLCTEAEWERAARGADTRTYPHGYVLRRDDANHDATYGKVHGAYGPDPVGSHPASASPFGVLDLVGNAFEFVAARSDQVRGGSWYQGPTTADIANHSTAPGTHEAFLGIRICADLPGS